MKNLQVYCDRGVALVMAMAVLFVSCSLPDSGSGSLSSSALVSSAGRAIDTRLDSVRSLIEDDLGTELGVDGLEGLTGADIATRALEEENGQAYLEFLLASESAESVDEVLEAAAGLAPDEELESIREVLDGYESEVRSSKSLTRYLTASEQKAFYSDLTAMVVECAVLLVSAVVYAYLPNTVLWGKVTAAAAVALTAGLVATTICAIVESYKLDMDNGETFELWLETVTTEPAAAVAIATSMFSLGTSLGRSTVTTSIILAIFALYNVVDYAEDMLEAYDFSF